MKSDKQLVIDRVMEARKTRMNQRGDRYEDNNGQEEWVDGIYDKENNAMKYANIISKKETTMTCPPDKPVSVVDIPEVITRPFIGAAAWRPSGSCSKPRCASAGRIR
jgi:hypothetical protein